MFFYNNKHNGEFLLNYILYNYLRIITLDKYTQFKIIDVIFYHIVTTLIMTIFIAND